MVTLVYCDRCASQTQVGRIHFQTDSTSRNFSYGLRPDSDLCTKCTDQLVDLINKFIATPLENSQ